MNGLYARQSIEKKDSLSIPDQLHKCRNEIPADEQYREYSDPGYSGKDTSRPDFLRMINDIKRGEIRRVIAYKLDRITRSIVDFANFMQLLEKHHVEFISVTEKFDTATPIGRAVLSIIIVFAQLERETIQARVTDNYYSRGRQGFYLGGRPPFGFDKVETYIHGKKTYAFSPNPVTSLIVQELYEKYAVTDISLGGLVKFMLEKGSETISGNPWSATSLGRLLRNPAFVKADADIFRYLRDKGATMNNDVSEYAGTNGCYIYAHRKGESKSKFSDLSKSFATLSPHKGIVISSIWLRCQRKLDQNKQLKNSGKGTHTWLTGLMKCEYCNLAVTVAQGGRGHKYLTCSGRKQGICFGRDRAIEVNDIEAVIEDQIKKRIQNYKNVPSGHAKQTDSIESVDIKIQLIKIDEEIKKYLDQIPNASKTLALYISQRVDELDTKKKEIEIKQKRAMSRQSIKSGIPYNLLSCEQDWLRFSFVQKRGIAQRLIEKVMIGSNTIKVIFK